MTYPIGDIPPSTIPAVQTYLLNGLTALLTADPDADGLLVCQGEPGTYQPEDIVYIGDVHQTYSPYSEVGTGGPFWLREDYQQSICVSVLRGGGDEAAVVMNRACALTNLIVNYVRSDPSLNGLVDRARPAQVTYTPQWDHEHAGQRVDVEISIDIMNVL
jgi:hypothetical protein